MGLAVLVCNCHNSAPLAREFLVSHGHDSSMPRFYRGDEARAWVNKNNLSDLISYLSNQSTFIIFVGWDKKKNVYWADINLPSAKEKIKAESILERFG